ncbi:class I SAM-dependent methyltransferase [Burkholderia sp. Ac-20345]|uniref:class I SAM-dependent methyltransferase n=1 Tax=Burkholderia sp. Ac-20345 TaxID=2703891 RepID=UPI00197B5C50|nr:class I SAM-dependent methyltransferase [Burkholderia sp. Ac-20345]MBN3782355.1 class I SAM-dependent methyltransferase [Burkholderia sp. Ac-20345]
MNISRRITALFSGSKTESRIAPDCFSLEYDKCSTHISGFNEASDFSFVLRGKQTNEKVALVSNGQKITSDPIKIGDEHIVDISLCVPSSGNHASISLRCVEGDRDASALSTLYIPKSKPNVRHDFRISLAAFSGKTLRLEMVVGEGRVGISRFLVCASDSISRMNALSNYAHRLQNEVSIFSNAYNHSMYGAATDEPANSSAIEKHWNTDSREESFLADQEAIIRGKILPVSPVEGESVFGFAQRCLGNAIPLSAPNFHHRTAALRRGRPIRVLSLCSGAARIEEEIFKSAVEPVELTLLDACDELIKRAAARMSHERHQVRCLVGDINSGIPHYGEFDVIVCVSALHHVANLERVISQINECLAPDGEFWSIGEQIGRNGNRLWPETLKAANQAFSRLPAQYRKNSHTAKIDESISDDDFSTGCFEGIRSEELEVMLDRFMIPVDVYKRNCFLWRLTDTTYCDNFDITSPKDLAHLKDLIIAEAMHWISGGRGTEMHAVYRRKQF